MSKGLVQDCSNSSALALELLQSCAKPLMLPSHVSYRVSRKLGILFGTEFEVFDINEKKNRESKLILILLSGSQITAD